MEQTEAEAYNYQTKKQNSKTQSTTFTDQPKFNKNEDFYKAKLNKLLANSSTVKYIPEIDFSLSSEYFTTKHSF